MNLFNAKNLQDLAGKNVPVKMKVGSLSTEIAPVAVVNSSGTILRKFSSETIEQAEDIARKYLNAYHTVALVTKTVEIKIKTVFS